MLMIKAVTAYDIRDNAMQSLALASAPPQRKKRSREFSDIPRSRLFMLFIYVLPIFDLIAGHTVEEVKELLMCDNNDCIDTCLGLIYDVICVGKSVVSRYRLVPIAGVHVFSLQPCMRTQLHLLPHARDIIMDPSSHELGMNLTTELTSSYYYMDGDMYVYDYTPDGSRLIRCYPH